MSALGLRITPPALFGRTGARYVIERNYLVYRRIWMIVFSGFVETLLYLFAARVGIGGLVGDIELASGRTVEYAVFVAPALLAASAMNGAIFESTMNIFHKLRYAKTYDAMLSTPLQPTDIALGEIAWSQFRGALYATGYLLVLLAMGLIESVWALLALPAALLIGFAFGAVGMSATSFMRSWQDFDLVNLAILVLFLFSATFFPLSAYPGPVQAIAHLSPLYHGVALVRGLMLGEIGWYLIGHAAFLGAMCAVGLTVAGRRLKLLLTP